MNMQKNFIFNNTFPIHYQPSFELKNMDDSFTEHLQYNELLGLSNNIENEQHWSDSAETKTIQHWSDSEIKTLLSYLSDNFDCYRTNKTKFYAKAAIKIGNNRIGAQVRSKLQALIARFEEENREKTGKGRSEWPYFDDMNEIFGNRENVHPDYFVSNIDIDKVFHVNLIIIQLHTTYIVIQLILNLFITACYQYWK